MSCYSSLYCDLCIVIQSAIESLLGASMTGVAYSLFAGQPLTILGSTGPVLVFEKILFKFCKYVFQQRHCDFFLIDTLIFICHWFPIFCACSPTSGTTTCPICHCGPASACGRPCCVCSWLLRMQALWCATSLGSQRRPSLPSFASSLSTKPWRNSSTWEKSTHLMLTAIWTNSRWHCEMRASSSFELDLMSFSVSNWQPHAASVCL